jgi:hypothetical protein
LWGGTCPGIVFGMRRNLAPAPGARKGSLALSPFRFSIHIRHSVSLGRQRPNLSRGLCA